MKTSRRDFLKIVGLAGGSTLVSGRARGSESPPVLEGAEDWYGCLVDLSLCEGCRKCELACNEANELPSPDVPFDDKSVFEKLRRPSATEYTVVNRYQVPHPTDPEQTKRAFSKVQCMHCKDPACVSACLVGAFTKDKETGAVVYDGSRCMGCRYCMVACPFQVPAYEYFNAFTPVVRKCQYCVHRISKEGGLPACVKMCPKEAITFGIRDDLVKLGWEKIKHPGGKNRKHGPYVEHLYGENEVGGTGWMYLSTVPFYQLGFLILRLEAPPRTTESIQHGIFKHFVPPIALYTLLGVCMYLFKDKNKPAESPEG